MGEVPRADAITRDGARIGHRLAVTGSVGDAQGALQLAYAKQIDESSCAHQKLKERLDKPTHVFKRAYICEGLPRPLWTCPTDC